MMSEELRLVLESNQLIIQDRIEEAKRRRDEINSDSVSRIRDSRFDEGDFIEKAEVIDKQITGLLNDLLEEKSLFNKRKFKKNNPELVMEWEKYKKAKIKDGLDLSLDFFQWMGHVKKINWKDEKKQCIHSWEKFCSQPGCVEEYCEKHEGRKCTKCGIDKLTRKLR